MEPSPTDSTARQADGRFGLGNRFATGNPHASKIQRLRAAMLAALSEDDIGAIIRKLIQLAAEGDLQAAKLLLQTIGRPEAEHYPVPTPTERDAPADELSRMKITPENLAQAKQLLQKRIDALAARELENGDAQTT